MRVALCALALAALSSSAALAQATDFRAQSGAVLQIQREPILDGVWRTGVGDLALTTRQNGILEGELDGRPCHGQHQANVFAIFCVAEGRGPFLFSGVAIEQPPVATQRRARIVAQPARMEGQIHQSYLSAGGHTEEIGRLVATRQ
ncbi:MAG: hypothetical protein AB7T59_07240 [Hyphomonadaceae bacterium]